MQTQSQIIGAITSKTSIQFMQHIQCIKCIKAPHKGVCRCRLVAVICIIRNSGMLNLLIMYIFYILVKKNENELPYQKRVGQPVEQFAGKCCYRIFFTHLKSE